MVGLLSLAWAADLPLPPSVSDAEAPVLEWAPLLRLDSGLSSSQGPVSEVERVALAGRVGMEASRRALTARVSVAGETDLRLEEDGASAGSGELRLSEAWAKLDPYISEALLVHLTIGQQAVEFNEGRVVGAQDIAARGQFPVAARLHLTAAPWSTDAVIGWRSEGPPEYPWWAARVGAGRERSQQRWQVDLVATGASRGDDGATLTAGTYAVVEQGRVRGEGDAYIQDWAATSRLGAAGGARLGWAFGGDARVVAGGAVEGATAESDDTVPFARPWGDLEDAVCPVARLVRGGIPAGHDGALEDGCVGGGAFFEAIVTPGLRVEAGALHYADAEGWATGAEFDLDARLYFGPYAWLRQRAGAFFPYDPAEPVSITAALSLDVQI